MRLKEDSAMRLLPFKKPFKRYETIIGKKYKITLKELDGTLVQFQSNSQCVIQLHFKKD